MSRTSIKVSSLSALLNPLTYAVLNIGVIVLLYFGGVSVNAGKLTQGEIIALVNYMTQILTAMIVFANLLVTFTKASASAARINEVFDVTTSMEEGNGASPDLDANAIELNDVTFTYSGSSAPSLSDVNLKIAKGMSVGILGGTGSGKTTLVKALQNRFGENITVLSHDNYYKRHDELPFEERCKLNYDHPDAFDNALLIYHLQELKAGRAIDCPVYDYADHNRSNEVQHIEPAPVLIVEGILPFVEPELCAMFDYKIFVDTDADERILRRLVRDVKERGRSLDSVINQYLTTVKPMHEAFVEPSKRNADIIVPNGGENTTAIEMLAHHIRSLIEKANML